LKTSTGLHINAQTSTALPITDSKGIAMPPTWSPWGEIQTCHTIADGIYQVTTASHGGYMLSPDRVAAMPAVFVETIVDGCFEEDCEWCFVPLAFPALFTPPILEEARRTCQNWFPTQWERWTGQILPLKDSLKKREAVWQEAHKSDWVVISAWGDWHEAVPSGFVGVCATVGGVRHATAEQRYFLVPEREYTIPFAVDPSKHPAIPPIT
jgi:hypothetical protein